MSGTKDFKNIKAVFYEFENGKMPAREEILKLSADDRKAVGEDIKTAEFQWPIGKPKCSSLKKGLWEVRSHISSKRIFRVIFGIDGGLMVLLHAFVKKTQKTPTTDLDTAQSRWKDYKNRNSQ